MFREYLFDFIFLIISDFKDIKNATNHKQNHFEGE